VGFSLSNSALEFREGPGEMEEGEICASCGDQCGCSWQLELSIDLGFGFYWVRVSFSFFSDSRAELDNLARTTCAQSKPRL
jgi:hypothetical protein